MENEATREAAEVSPQPEPGVTATPAYRFPSKEELLFGDVEEEKLLVKFDTGQQFLLRKIQDIADRREITEQATLLQKMQLEDKQGNKFFPDEFLCLRMALLSASLETPAMTARECLLWGRRQAEIVEPLANHAMILNGLADAEVEVLKNG